MKDDKRSREHRLWMFETVIQIGKIRQRLNRRKKRVLSDTITAVQKLHDQALGEWESLYDK